MSVRQDVFDYLKKHPKSSLEETKSEFPDSKDTTLKRYYFEFKKLKQPADTPKKPATAEIKPEKKLKAAAKKKAPAKKASEKPIQKKSTRQEVLNYLKKNPEASTNDLYKAFSEDNQKTIRNYRLQWKKAQAIVQSDLTIEKKVFKYLDKNPESNLNDLRNEFSDIDSLITIFRSWKKKNSATSSKPSKPVSENEEPVKVEKQKDIIEEHKTIIEKQKEIIEKQKTRIDALKSQVANSINKGFTKKIRDFIIDRLIKK